MIETIPDRATWENKQIAYHYYRSPRRRTMGITVHSDLSVTVRAPLRTGRDAIQRFVLARAGWITRTQERLALRLPPEPPNYTSGEFHYYTGKRYRLEITQGSKDAVACVADTLLVTSRGEPTGEKVRKVLDGWYRSRAEILFHERLAACHARVAHEQIPLPALRIKRMRSRLGELFPEGDIVEPPPRHGARRVPRLRDFPRALPSQGEGTWKAFLGAHEEADAGVHGV